MTQKYLIVCLALALVAVSRGAVALPPIDKEWKERYLETIPPPPFKGAAQEQKCNVCHEGMKKKDKNEYGQAVGKHITKKGVDGLKGMDAALKKYIEDGLKKAEEEQNSAGKKFGDIMKKDGKLPGEK